MNDRAAPVPTVYIVDDDPSIRKAMEFLMRSVGLEHAIFHSADAFLARYTIDLAGCLLLDIRMPGLGGLELQQKLIDMGSTLPIIFITGHGDVPMAVAAMRAGAVDFLEKPVQHGELLASIDRALARASSSDPSALNAAAAARIAELTARQRQVLDHVVAGHANKEIAARLGISQRTVENHRAVVMDKTRTKSLPDLIRLVMQAG
jgi:two-component system CheB/CheR fusion protein